MNQYEQRWATGFAKTAGSTFIGNRPKPKGLKSSDMLDKDSFWTGASDMIDTGATGGERAGKAEVMAKSIGRKPSLAVTHPQMHAGGSALAGAGLGGIGGGIAGAVVGAIAGAVASRNSGNDPSRVIGQAAFGAAGVGAMGGGIAGLIGGLIHSGRKRSHEIEDISADFDKADTVNPNYRKANPLGLLGMTGPHSRGRTKALQAELGLLPTADQSPESILTSVLARVPMPGAPLAAGLFNASNMYQARKERQEALMRAHGRAPISETGLFSRQSYPQG